MVANVDRNNNLNKIFSFKYGTLLLSSIFKNTVCHRKFVEDNLSSKLEISSKPIATSWKHLSGGRNCIDHKYFVKSNTRVKAAILLPTELFMSNYPAKEIVSVRHFSPFSSDIAPLILTSVISMFFAGDHTRLNKCWKYHWTLYIFLYMIVTAEICRYGHQRSIQFLKTKFLYLCIWDVLRFTFF